MNDLIMNLDKLHTTELGAERIKRNLGIELVHPVKEHSWGQRAVRFYDPDGHIIEVGENITAVARRFENTGMTVKEIATRMDVREEYVQEWLEGTK